MACTSDCTSPAGVKQEVQATRTDQEACQRLGPQRNGCGWTGVSPESLHHQAPPCLGSLIKQICNEIPRAPRDHGVAEDGKRNLRAVVVESEPHVPCCFGVIGPRRTKKKRKDRPTNHMQNHTHETPQFQWQSIHISISRNGSALLARPVEMCGCVPSSKDLTLRLT